MSDLNVMLSQWTDATADLKYGVQRVFHDVFTLASEGKTTLIYGADYHSGSPCLVNTVGSMLTTGGGVGVPSANFGQVVYLFDQINRALRDVNVNEENGYVSPLAAEVFLKNFAPLKDAPEPTEPLLKANYDLGYSEPSDEDMAADLVRMFSLDVPCEITFDENNLSLVEVNVRDNSQNG